MEEGELLRMNKVVRECSCERYQGLSEVTFEVHDASSLRYGLID